MKYFTIIILTLFLIAGCGQQKSTEINPTALLDLHNQERIKNNLEPLKLDDFLGEYAINHSEWMAKKNILQHSNISNLLGRYKTVGENIAWNQPNEKSVHNAWMNSRPHRANILNAKFKLIGFGMKTNSKGQPYWCAVFGS